MNEKKKKIIAAISGGVDSSVAAAIFVEKGYEVIGVTLKMKSCDENVEKAKSCCGIDDNMQARAAAALLGIPHYFLDVRTDFSDKVLRRAWDEYSSARTPNPCALCNRHLKFGKLIEYARSIGAEGVITGHYSRIISENGKNVLRRGFDTAKDQSYFLFALTSEQLSMSFMPLGTMTKPEVREYARKISLPNAEKIESQDACFGIKDESFAETLRKLFKSPPIKGYFVDDSGKVLGRHDGLHQFTIGQRKGLGIAMGKPAYISRIDLKTGDITLSTDEQKLLSASLLVSDINWQQQPSADEFECDVQIRYRSKPARALVSKVPDSASYMVRFASPQRAVTPGQAAVFYDADLLLGGGWIEKTF